MSTLDSWIDREELAEVVAALVPASGPSRAKEEDAPTESEATSVSTQPEDGAFEDDSGPVGEVETFSPELEPSGEPEKEPATEFSEPETVTDEVSDFTPETIELEPTGLEEPKANEEEEVFETPQIESFPDQPEQVIEEVEAVISDLPADEGEESPASDLNEVPMSPWQEFGNSDGDSDLDNDTPPAPEETHDLQALDPEETTIEEVEEILSTEEEIVDPSSIDFDEPQAYDAAPFPSPTDPNPESPISPLRRTAAVQAAAALERARDRAQEGGLLKHNVPAASQVETIGNESEAPLPEEEPSEPTPDHWERESPPEAEASATEETPSPSLDGADPFAWSPQSLFSPHLADSATEATPPGAEDAALTTPPAEPELESTEFSDKAPSESLSQDQEEEPPASVIEEAPFEATKEPASPPVAENGAPTSLRARLQGFADRAGASTNAGSIAITDFQSYPLLAQNAAPAPAHSALRMSNLFGLMATEFNSSRDGTTQIALGTGDWLCVVAADSAAGGVCASFRLTEPVSDELARDLANDLRATLGERPVAS